MDIVNYIRDLLYYHDCVIVPGFGGFVTNERAALIDRASGGFYPPARDVGFNARLNHNDGLLISHISARLSINYVDAKKLVDTFTGRVINRLEEGRMISFDGIGQFASDRSGNLQFDPDPSANFLPDSYGLGFYRFPVLDSYKPAGKIKNRRLDGRRAGLTGRTRRLLRYAAVGIPLIAALSWGAMNTDIVREFSFNLSSLNPFSAVVDTGIRHTPSSPETIVTTVNRDKTTGDLAEDPVPENLSEETAVPLSEKMVADLTEAEPSPAITEMKSTGSSIAPVNIVTAPYHLVAGSFRSRNNALLFKDELAREGYNSMLLDSEKGLYRVSVFSSRNRGEAVVMLNQLRTQAGKTDLWLLSI